jgi:hypothetical protein
MVRAIFYGPINRQAPARLSGLLPTEVPPVAGWWTMFGYDFGGILDPA